jgi:hypothetical protein
VHNRAGAFFPAGPAGNSPLTVRDSRLMRILFMPTFAGLGRAATKRLSAAHDISLKQSPRSAAPSRRVVR